MWLLLVWQVQMLFVPVWARALPVWQVRAFVPVWVRAPLRREPVLVVVVGQLQSSWASGSMVWRLVPGVGRRLVLA